MPKRKISLSLALFALALVVLPRAGLACAVCFSGLGDRALWGYYVSTIMLSALPFALMGVVVLAVYLTRNRGYAAPETRADTVPIGENRN